MTEIDNKNHLALCAYIVNQDGMFGIGVDRYIRVEEEPETAEFTLTIIDEYQSQGLGTGLLNLLILCAHKNGIRKFIGYMLAEIGIGTPITERPSHTTFLLPTNITH